MVAHDPLTTSQQTLPQELEQAPFELTIQEQSTTSRGRDLGYLMALGLVTIEATYVAQEQLQNRHRFSWSGKRR